MQEEYFNIEGLGKVYVERRPLSRRASLCVSPFKGIRLTLPRGMGMVEALRFVEGKRDWIIRARQKISLIEAGRTLLQPGVHFSTRQHRLDWKEGTNSRRFIFRIEPGRLLVEYPPEADFTKSGVQEILRRGVEETLRQEAKSYLPDRLALLAQKHGLHYTGPAVKNMRSRWGSCSSAGHINLNLHLMRLPDELIDYVLLHELAHTEKKNHGPGFWDFLNLLTEGKAKKLDREVKKYHTAFY